ncbi:MAG: rod shape-determining protein [Lachnospiraceae bacterium]|nr:rod shape-determining protein [Lachnospiraceae bacterium]
MQKMRRVKAKPPVRREDGRVTDIKSIMEERALEEAAKESRPDMDLKKIEYTEEESKPSIVTDGEPIVFGLDIGTRSIVGTVGYMKDERFRVIAIHSHAHETRSMLDGQIHDIKAVSNTIRQVKEHLENETGLKLKDVCIAAAGRVLRTVNTHVEKDFEEEKDITAEDIYSLELQGAQQAYTEFLKNNDLNMKFYCVGYTVVRYYLAHYAMNELENHKGSNIGADLIATFLPDEVVDGLYKAVNMAGLNVANLTLEPIAAMEVAIPADFRMLNIALVDVGAGTSDISITKDGAIIAYGMIPSAGDEITETIAKGFLCGFDQAEKIKMECDQDEPIEFTDIMGLKQTTNTQAVRECVSDTVRSMTREISDKIKKLNGGKSVSAVFVVGGGGKVKIFTEYLADELGIIPERVAVRGEEVLKVVDFMTDELKVDSLLVTPVGICLNFYNMKNNFIFVDFNGVQIKLYDNNNLRVVDAALQSGFSNQDLFPKHGADITYTINGKTRITRGEVGEGAVIKLNGEEVSMNEKIKAGDIIEAIPSTAGAAAVLELGKLPEFTDSLHVELNGNKIELPKFASVNGELKSAYYSVQDGDKIEMLKFYTVRQILDFMDIAPEDGAVIYVNRRAADEQTEVYDNFTVNFTIKGGEVYVNEVDDGDEITNMSFGGPANISSSSEPKENDNAQNNESSGMVLSYEDLPDDDGSYEAVKEVSVAKAQEKEEEKKRQEIEASERLLAKLREAQEAVKALHENTGKLAGGGEVKAVNPESEVKSEPEEKPVPEIKPEPEAKPETEVKPEPEAENESEIKAEPEVAETKPEEKPSPEPADEPEMSQFVSQAADNLSSKPESEEKNEPADKKETEDIKESENKKEPEENKAPTETKETTGSEEIIEDAPGTTSITVTANGEKIRLTGRKEYIFVDIFDHIDFDRSTPKGSMVVIKRNGKGADYTEVLENGDNLEVYWS